MFEVFINSSEYISIAGSSVAIIGSIFLAFAMGKVFWELSFAITAISVSIQSMTQGRDAYVFGGLDKRIERAQQFSKFPTMLGVSLILLSLPFQMYSLHLSNINAQEEKSISLKSRNEHVAKFLSIEKSVGIIHHKNDARYKELETQFNEATNKQNKKLKEFELKLENLTHNKLINSDA